MITPHSLSPGRTESSATWAKFLEDQRERLEKRHSEGGMTNAGKGGQGGELKKKKMKFKE